MSLLERFRRFNFGSMFGLSQKSMDLKYNEITCPTNDDINKIVFPEAFKSSTVPARNFMVQAANAEVIAASKPLTFDDVKQMEDRFNREYRFPNVKTGPTTVAVFDGPVVDTMIVDSVASSPLVPIAPQTDIQKSFEKFHRENPKVYSRLVELAYAAKANGHKTLGIGLLWERLRWHYTVDVKTQGKFILNNNHRSRYARMIMMNEPALAGFFKTRALY